MKPYIWCCLAVFAVQAADLPVASLRIEPGNRTLRGAGAHQQLVAIGRFADGSERDLTEAAQWAVSDPSTAELDSGPRLKAIRNGAAIVRASIQGRHAQAKFTIQDIDNRRPFEFGLDIGGIFTRKGCNSPACHGGVKGRGGFKLSSGALHPKEDYEWIVKGGAYQVLTAEVSGPRTPRINLQDPEKSLLLLKPTGTVAHGGGRRFSKDSEEYQKILKWIQDGAPFGREPSVDNRTAGIDVFPRIATLESGGKQQLLVTAHFADGRTEDCTDQAMFLSSDREIAKIDESGRVVAGKLGETSILVRAAGQVSSATIGVIGGPVAQYPRVKPVNFVDEFVFDKLRRFRIVPSPQSNESEFLRRICLDLTGMLPPANRVEEFLANRDPGKREKLIDTLIGSPEFVDYLTFRFNDLFRVAVFSNGIRPKWSQMYGEWVRASIAANQPYDVMAKERLAAEGYDGPTRHYLPYDVIGPPGDTMAEEVRVFFGRRLDCAQCHNHPYESWSQDQFWGMAAFFGRQFKMGDTGNEYVIFEHPLTEGLGNNEVNGSLKMYHPRTKLELKPTLLDGTVVNVGARQNQREALADWMVKQPYFDEAAVNRVWSWFFGRGIVDPVDDFRSTNPPTHPELLQRLAADFRDHHYNLRYLIRLIVTSATYQLSGLPQANNESDRTNYSHRLPRALDAEVLLDAICDVTGVPETFTMGGSEGSKNPPGLAPFGTRAINLREPDMFYSRFLDIYGRPNRLTLPERSGKVNLGEALDMLAGPVYNEKLSAARGRLQQLLKAGKTDTEIVEEFYLAAFTRLPEPEELARVRKLLEQRGDREEGLKDFVWAVLCSREFADNH